MGSRVARGFTLFMNWFDGVCAVVCGGWMALGALVALPVSWNDCMDIGFLSGMPLADVLFTTWFWPGLALLLINGLPNVIALVLRFRGNRAGSYAWSIVAGALLICWTAFEMLFIPNALSVFYLVLGVAQLACGIVARRSLQQAGE